jgi:membrane-bound metal-dependent hydrolase YbcI (DUF457 family)
LVLFSGWCCRRLTPLRPRTLTVALFAGVAALAVLFPPDPALTGVAAGAGWFSHVLADGCTTWGVPLVWPLEIKGKRWYRVRLLGSYLESGQDSEWLVACVVAALFVVPPAWWAA